MTTVGLESEISPALSERPALINLSLNLLFSNKLSSTAPLPAVSREQDRQ
jgi:hypothetical protein